MTTDTQVITPEPPNPPPQVEVTTVTTAQVKTARPENWRTLLFVGLAIICALLVMAYWAFGKQWTLYFWLPISLVEAWSLINAYAEDTISEAVWILSQRPIVVVLFVYPLALATGLGYFGDPQTVVRAHAVGILYGHFFFSRDHRAFVTSLTQMYATNGKAA